MHGPCTYLSHPSPSSTESNFGLTTRKHNESKLLTQSMRTLPFLLRLVPSIPHALTRHSLECGTLLHVPDKCKVIFVVRVGFQTQYRAKLIMYYIDFRVGRVKVVFTLPVKAQELLFRRDRQPPKYLAYIEWFTKFPPMPDSATKMYPVRKALRNGETSAFVVPIELISRSVHLLPKWGRKVPLEWKSENVLDICPTFLVNSFKDMSTYVNVK